MKYLQNCCGIRAQKGRAAHTQTHVGALGSSVGRDLCGAQLSLRLCLMQFYLRTICTCAYQFFLPVANTSLANVSLARQGACSFAFIARGTELVSSGFAPFCDRAAFFPPGHINSLSPGRCVKDGRPAASQIDRETRPVIPVATVLLPFRVGLNKQGLFGPSKRDR